MNDDPTSARSPAPTASAPRPRRSSAARFAEAIDARMLMLVRGVLAYSAFGIVMIDASEPHRWVELTRISLAVYCAYSTLLVIGGARSGWPQPNRAQHWTDVAFYVYLVMLTGGAGSLFFNFFLFAVLAASFTRGFREGMLVTVVSLASYALLGVTMGPESVDFELNRELMRTVYLFVFGYMISYWGGYESLLKRRLALLNEINNAWSPRFGVDHAIGQNLNRLLDFYHAESCVLVLRRPDCVIYRGAHGKPDAASRPLPVPDKAGAPLLVLPDLLAAYYHGPGTAWYRRWRGFAACDVASRLHVREHEATCAGLANLLDASSYVTVPYAQRNGVAGRLFLVNGRTGFSQSDIDFLAQVAAAIATVVENITLMDELISRASEQERMKISRDLHDSTIQPYIGLKLALDALVREAGDANPLAKRLTELDNMAAATIRDLRDYAAAFRNRQAMPDDFLLAAVRKKVERLHRFYGIEVALDATMTAQIDGRLAAEVFHIVSEGLSNILRHTTARQAFVHLRCADARLLVDIGNEAGVAAAPFTPRSIFDRVLALGGAVTVDCGSDGYTVVRISIPVPESAR
ncbi:MAG TPA: histidine kinase [Noviherbaspirillum sp.]